MLYGITMSSKRWTRSLFWQVVRSELSMGLRPTNMDENRIEPRVTLERPLNGRAYSGSVEAVSEFGLGCMFWTNLCSAIHASGLDR
jgi:hypothetical protein